MSRIFRVSLTGYQIKHLLDLADQDDDCELSVGQCDEWIDPDTKEMNPAGLYAWYTDYPDEGLTLLPDLPTASDASEKPT